MTAAGGLALPVLLICSIAHGVGNPVEKNGSHSRKNIRLCYKTKPLYLLISLGFHRVGRGGGWLA
jgi:hypothetical protein